MVSAGCHLAAPRSRSCGLGWQQNRFPACQSRGRRPTAVPTLSRSRHTEQSAGGRVCYAPEKPAPISAVVTPDPSSEDADVTDLRQPGGAYTAPLTFECVNGG